jgi:hypothetical protein
MAEYRTPLAFPVEERLGSEGSATPSGFPPTDWGLVVSAGAESRPALERLCRVYWGPAYAFVRRAGHGRDAALELMREFFAAIIEQNAFSRVKAGPEPFRVWLLTALEEFLVGRTEGRRRRTAVVGGVALDVELADALDRAGDRALEPQREYERVLALSVLERALARLESDQAERGQRQRFLALKPWLVAEPSRDELSALERTLGLRPTSVKMALHTLRQRLGSVMRYELANLLERRDDTEGLRNEMDALMNALGG